MPNPRLAGRYAKSLVDLATERGQLEAVYADMKYLEAVCKASSDFRNLLRSPVINADQKNSIINAVTKGKVSELTAAFATLLVKKGREGDLPEIATAFVDQYNELKGIHKMKQSIESKVKTEKGLGNIELETAVDEKLIGGFVLEFNNNLVDASILRDLKDIKKQFTKNLFVQNLR
jgi:F-type H+-transporting ATPase subunit delta